MTTFNIWVYNIAFVNPERRLVKRRVYITQCKHGKFPATYKFFVSFGLLTLLYYTKNYKTFFRGLEIPVKSSVEYLN